jgi:histidine triad (HIT) family protein
MTECIFCQIIAKTAPATILYEDEMCVVFKPIQPLTPLHLLIVPRQHFDSLNEMSEEDADLIGHLLLTAKLMAERAGVAEHGYRVAINTGAGGGQTVFHLHVHLLSGKPISENLLGMGLR